MTDLSKTIAPKSDQMNSDDLISGPITVKVSRVTGTEGDAQPISIHYEGDKGKPYKPCKSMRRVLVMVWGDQGNEYVGRSMTLYRDEKVIFGGIAVGGIRISHMSGLEKDFTMALTTTRASRKPYTVKPLAISEDPRTNPLYQETVAFSHEIAGATSDEKLNAIEPRFRELLEKLIPHQKWRDRLIEVMRHQRESLSTQ